MAVDRDLRTWLPGALKLSSGEPVPDTSIVFPEDIVHPSFTNPNITVGTAEEDIINFSYYLLTALLDHAIALPDADVPKDFSIRRNFVSSTTSEGLSSTFIVTLPLETALLFGRKETA